MRDVGFDFEMISAHLPCPKPHFGQIERLPADAQAVAPRFLALGCG
jgi:hypothetical protein